MFNSKTLLIMLAIILTNNFTERVYAQAGTLDKSFGNNGIAITDFSHRNDRGQKLALQDDGKIILAGYSVDSLNKGDIAVCRYLSNGVLDKSFGKNGKYDLGFSNMSVVISTVAIQKDKKIILGGGGNDHVFLERLNTNGFPDSTFGINGIVIYDTSYFDIVFDLKIQTDGKIVTAGQTNPRNGSLRDIMAVHRFNSDGSIDSTFGTNGDVLYQYSADTHSGANDLVIQQSGKIVIGLWINIVINNIEYSHIGLIRLNSDGTFDQNFGIAGLDTIFIHSPYDAFLSLALQKDQKIIASQMSFDGHKNNFALVRFKANSGIDSSFGMNGIAMTGLSGQTTTNVEHDDAFSVCVDSDGNIYQAGVTSAGTNADFGLVKYKSSGVLDSSFGNNGIVITPILKSDDYAESVIAQPDSKVIVAGYSQNDSDQDFSVARYNNTSILPVSLLSFTAQKQNSTTLLQWQTANEINNNYFSIERSADSKTFSAIGTQQALASNNANNYSFVDSKPLKGINYYRLKQVDKDSKYTYSNIVSVVFTDNGVFAIAPNPANNFITVTIPSSNVGSDIFIYTVDGKKVLHQLVAANSTSTQINITALTAGVYNVVVLQNGKKEVVKMVKK